MIETDRDRRGPSAAPQALPLPARRDTPDKATEYTFADVRRRSVNQENIFCAWVAAVEVKNIRIHQTQIFQENSLT